MIALLAVTAFATPGFDATAPAARYEDSHTYTLDGTIKIWSAIERLEDPDRTLFAVEDFNQTYEWKGNDFYAPHIQDSFGGSRPGSWASLLHMGPAEPVAEGTPILFVHGAGDNASRGFVTMATRMDRAWRPVYALTFAHPHGDVFMHAEQIANAIARIKERTGASQVDIVSHSKGGIATAVYLANEPGVDWNNAAYQSVGTTYRDDVRRAVFVATPLDGIDTGYRWPSGNYASLDADTALSPASWDTYYPSGTAFPLINDDLSGQDFRPDGPSDPFPGHRQLLRRQTLHDLPGNSPSLGAYALQQDWYTTYEGGFGFYSHSAGIDAAIADGGHLLDKLEAQGIDPDVEIYVLAGDNALMASAGWDYLTGTYDQAFIDMAEASSQDWGELMAGVVSEGLADFDLTQAEAAGIVSGDLMLGEISGPSDGVVFVSSAVHTDTLTARGAQVKEVKIVDLSHIDLLYASPITGQSLVDLSDDAPENAYMAPWGERYIQADTLGWVEGVLADPVVEEPGDTGSTDTGSTDTGPGVDTGDFDGSLGNNRAGCEGCSGAGAPALGWLALTPLLLSLRRRRA